MKKVEFDDLILKNIPKIIIEKKKKKNSLSLFRN
jgi:hypothetical protein